MDKKMSRGSSLDMVKCVNMAGGNQFEMILMAAARARELKDSSRYNDTYENRQAAVSSLIELSEGKYGREYLVKSVQQRSASAESHRQRTRKR